MGYNVVRYNEERWSFMSFLKKFLIFIWLVTFSGDAFAYTNEYHQKLYQENDVKYLTMKEKKEEAFIREHWYKSTFPTTMDSVRYHVKKHGMGKSPLRYTKDALKFYKKNKHLGKKRTLADGKTKGIKITTSTKGGIFTLDGHIVTFWYYNGQ